MKINLYLSHYDKSVGQFESKEEIKTWLEEFYQRNFDEEKIMYDEAKNKNKKYPALFPEFDLDYWFKQMKVKLVNETPETK